MRLLVFAKLLAAICVKGCVCTTCVNLSGKINLQSRSSEYFFTKVTVRDFRTGETKLCGWTTCRKETAGSFSGDHSSGLFL